MSALVLISVLGVVLLYLGLFGNRGLLAPVGIVGLLAAFVFFAADWQLENALFAGLVQFDTYARSFSMVLIVVTVLLFLFGIDYYAKVRENVAEQYALMLFSLIGGLLITSFSNLIVLFLGIEILSIHFTSLRVASATVSAVAKRRSSTSCKARSPPGSCCSVSRCCTDPRPPSTSPPLRRTPPASARERTCCSCSACSSPSPV